MRIAALRRKIFGNKTSLLLTSIIIGLLASCCAVILKNGVHLIRYWVHFASDSFPLLLFIFPTLGILLTAVYTQRVRKGDLGRGVTNIIYCISRRDSRVQKDKMYSQMLTSILTVGFGGSAGLEAPSASTGSAFGSNLASWLGFNQKERTLLLACGAAAGISAIFNAPIAGVVFAFEILLVDKPLPLVVPLLISSATAALLSPLINSPQPFVLITQPWHSVNIFHYLIFAVIAAFLSVYAIKAYFYFGDLFARSKRPYLRAIVGGLLLGGLIFLFPPLYGEGYESVLVLLHNQPTQLLADSLVSGNSEIGILIVFVLALMFLKVIATALTVGAGGNGGMFGSSLFTGAMCGYSYAHIINLSGLGHLNEVNFTVVGMAALMSGIIHTPLTAIFLIAEITGGYALFVPLMLTCSVSFLISRYFEPFSVYTKKLAMKGDLIIADKDKVVLAKMKLRNYIDSNFIAFNENDMVADAIKKISSLQNRDIFPVLNSAGALKGVIVSQTISDIIFSDKQYDSITVKQIMTAPKALLNINDSAETALKNFEQYNVRVLPVIDDGRFAGFVYRANIYANYRRLLIHEAEIPA